MRRAVLMVAFILAALIPPFAAEPAGAHACAIPVRVDEGEPAAVTIGVGAEAVAVTEVVVEVPDGFRLDEATGPDSWDVDVTGDGTVQYSGGSVAPYTCEYMTLRGRTEGRGKLVFPLVLTTEEGDSVRYDNPEPYYESSAQMLYVGMELPGLPDDGGGLSTLEVVGGVLVAVGVVGAITLLVVRGRRDDGTGRGARPAEDDVLRAQPGDGGPGTGAGAGDADRP